MASPPGSGGSTTPRASAAQAGLEYPGLVTRGISFALDAAAINLVAIIVGVGVSLILSLFSLPSVLKTILVAVGAAVYVIWLVGYFVFFWSTTGQTPGARVMQITVQTPEGGSIRPVRAIVRFGGLILATLPLFLGFVPVLFDENRRALQDRIAGTVVRNAPDISIAQARRARKREQYLASRYPPSSQPRQRLSAGEHHSAT